MSWATDLAEEIKNAELNKIILVDNTDIKELGERAAQRMNHSDLTFKIKES